MERAALESEARLFGRFKRLRFSPTADAIAASSSALNLQCEQYKTFEKHLLLKLATLFKSYHEAQKEKKNLHLKGSVAILYATEER